MLLGGCGGAAATSSSSSAAAQTVQVAESESAAQSTETQAAVQTTQTAAETAAQTAAQTKAQTTAQTKASETSSAVSSKKLTKVLDEIAAIEDGKAGSSLTYIMCASDLLDWAMNTNMSAADAKKAVKAYGKNISDKLSGVIDTADQLKGSDAKGMLADAGKDTGTGYPWNDAAFKLVDSLK